MSTDTDRRRTILLVNPNTNADTTDRMVAKANTVLTDTGFRTVGVTAARGPKMIVEPQALEDSARWAVDAAMVGIDRYRPVAVIVSAFGDPGADELRSRVEIPVIGIGQASILEAAQDGRRFAIATTTGLLADAMNDLVQWYCPTGDYAGLWLTEGDPLTLAQDTTASVSQLGSAIDGAVAAGARAVVIGGGPLSEPAQVLSLRTDATVIEPIPSAVRKALAEFRVSECSSTRS